jgi:hypothetical protein
MTSCLSRLSLAKFKPAARHRRFGIDAERRTMNVRTCKSKPNRSTSVANQALGSVAAACSAMDDMDEVVVAVALRTLAALGESTLSQSSSWSWSEAEPELCQAECAKAKVESDRAGGDWMRSTTRRVHNSPCDKSENATRKYLQRERPIATAAARSASKLRFAHDLTVVFSSF